MAVTVDIEKEKRIRLTLQLADHSMILGQRLAEWCGHGPVLEQDIALTNIALDLIGEARSLYQYVAELEGEGKTEDCYPFKRDVYEWQNILLVELPNLDFAYTIVRQFMFDLYHFHYLEAMQSSNDKMLAAIASKSLKEATYHLKFSSEWMIRLGDGTQISNQRLQDAMNNRIMYFEEVFIATDLEKELSNCGISPNLEMIHLKARNLLVEICKSANITIPQVRRSQSGGKKGRHTEHLGFILSDLQFMQKSYPNSKW